MKTILLAAFLLLLNTADCFAACVVTHNVTTNFIGSIPAIGQSFIATCGGRLASVTVTTGTPGTPAGPHTLKIYQGESATPADLLYTQANVNLGTVGNTINTVSLAQPVPVINGNQYTFIFEHATGGITILQADATNSYAGGKLYLNAGFVAGIDLPFQVNITDLPIPTLSEWGIIVFLLLLAAIALRSIKHRHIA